MLLSFIHFDIDLAGYVFYDISGHLLMFYIGLELASLPLAALA